MFYYFDFWFQYRRSQGVQEKSPKQLSSKFSTIYLGILYGATWSKTNQKLHVSLGKCKQKPADIQPCLAYFMYIEARVAVDATTQLVPRRRYHRNKSILTQYNPATNLSLSSFGLVCQSNPMLFGEWHNSGNCDGRTKGTSTCW